LGTCFPTKALYERFSIAAHPTITNAACYQNGLQHAIRRVMVHRRAGEYSSPALNDRREHRYLDAERHHRRLRNYTDAAYCEGYANGVLLALMETKKERGQLPLYFAFGERETRTIRQFQAALRRAHDSHKAAWTVAKRLASSLPPGLLYRHPPFCRGVVANPSRYVRSAVPSWSTRGLRSSRSADARPKVRIGSSCPSFGQRVTVLVHTPNMAATLTGVGDDLRARSSSSFVVHDVAI
jgi:hypothetical protein